MADKFTIVSWNVRGLGEVNKRFAVFKSLAVHLPAIILLQETHLTTDTVKCVQKKWVGWDCHSYHSNYSRGVSILVHRNLPFLCIDKVVDDEGRFICVYCTILQSYYVIAVLYIPPPYNCSILKKVLTFLAKYPTVPSIVMGDFNTTVEPFWDKVQVDTMPQGHQFTPFGRMLGEVGLFDVWRLKHPGIRQYSCHSSTYHTLSRIDMAIGNHLLCQLVSQVTYQTRTVSDHSPLLLQISIPMVSKGPRKTWKLNPFWLNIVDQKWIQTELTSYFLQNSNSAPHHVIWDAMKATLRGILIQQISRAKAQRRRIEEGLRSQVTATEQCFIISRSKPTARRWRQAQEDLSAFLLESAVNKRQFLQQTFFEEGEKAGHLLASVTQAQRGTTHISALLGPSGVLQTDTVDIITIMEQYYFDLYSPKTTATPGDIVQFLEGVSLPTLSQAQRTSLDSPVTLEELQIAVASLSNNKAPGLDGLPNELFKKFGEILLPQLLEVFYSSAAEGNLPATMQEAVIIVLLKPGKDPAKPESYRPISLLPVDAKIIAKVLASRLSRVISDLVHQDQTGFIPQKSTSINIRRLHLNLQLPSDCHGTRAVCSLDAAKAFDSVEWPFLWAVLEKFGFGPAFISWIKLFYTTPKARLMINGQYSPTFALGRGTRQGCPMSPLLFALAVEPLAATIRTTIAIRGFCRGTIEEKIALYADDMLLFLEDTTSSLTAAFEVIKTYGSFSGLTINWSKSVLMPIDGQTLMGRDLGVPLVCSDTFTYLGIVISVDLTKYEKLNLDPLFTRLQQKLEVWRKLPLSVVGRVNLIKMVWMPQLLYILHNAPVWLPQRLFYKINRLFQGLIWGKGTARIKLQSLQLAKDEGGLAVPDPVLYYLAAQLQHLRGWENVDSVDTGTQLLRSYFANVNLYEVLDSKGFLSNSKKFPTLCLIHKLWWKLRGMYDITGCTTYTSVWHTPWLTELCKLSGFESWVSKGIRRVKQILTPEGELKQFSDLQNEFALPHSQFFKFLQLRHACSKEDRELLATAHPLPPAEIVGNTETSKGLISVIYRYLLTQLFSKHPVDLKTKWEGDLGPIEPGIWEEILQAIPKVSVSEQHRLSQIYLIHRVYRTPLFLHKIGLRDSPICNRCCIHPASLLHMMWNCPKLVRYWDEVISLINATYSVTIDTDPMTCILGYVEDLTVDAYEKIAIARILFMARKVIAYHWLDSAPPIRQELINKVNWLLLLERGIYLKRHSPYKFEKMWAKWLDAPGLATAALLRSRLIAPSE